MDTEIKAERPKVIGLSALLKKTYEFLNDLPEAISRSFGRLVINFVMIVWGPSANGKSNFIYQFLGAMMKYGNVLYIGLEEGTEATTQLTALRHLNEENHGGKIFFADHRMNYDQTIKWLKRKKSPRFVVVDSIQYWDINYAKYKELKQKFPRKSFIFISHGNGKYPDGSTANRIRYDAGIKVRIEGFVAFVTSRYGGNRPYIIWEGEDRTKGAWNYWKRKRLNEFKK